MKKKNQLAEHKCAVCGHRTARLILMAKVFGRGANRVLIEDIPTYSCRNCGSQYLDGETMDAIDAIRAEPAAYTVRQTIAAATLAA
jgi:YgiT-type zinc finger domain-containing protein